MLIKKEIKRIERIGGGRIRGIITEDQATTMTSNTLKNHNILL